MLYSRADDIGALEVRDLGPASAAIVLCSVFLAGCGRSPEAASSERAQTGASAASPTPQDLDGLQVEFKSADAPAHLPPGALAEIRLKARNIGTKPWPATGDYPFVFGYHWEAPDANGNWAAVAEDDGNRGTLLADVPPGETVVVTLPIRALPTACPNCRVVIAPLLELRMWSETAKSIVPVNVS
jgi:hypothetical protein